MNPNDTRSYEPEDQAQTQPISPQLDPMVSPEEENEEKKGRRRWPWYILIYIAVVLAVSGVAYLQGKDLKEGREGEQVAQYLQEQYELGIQDMEAGRYENARQRFEAIIH